MGLGDLIPEGEMTFGDLLKKARFEWDLTQQDVADGTGISRVQIAYYEAGSNEPRVSIARRIATFCGFSLDLIDPGAPPVSIDDLRHRREVARIETEIRSLEKRLNHLKGSQS